MLTRFVRIQLVIFTIASTVGVIVMILTYLQVPTLLGIGKITVTVELPSSGGLYRFANVTYRGVQIGKVTALDVSRTKVTATLSLNTSPPVPSDLEADVRSVSAVGEQYIDLRPRTNTAPYLHEGSVVSMRDTAVPQQVGPMLDQVSALLNSIPKGKLSQLVDESSKAFGGADYDLGSLLDSSSAITSDLNSVADQSSTLLEDSEPLFDAQARTTDAVRQWTRYLAGITGQVVTDDPQVRALLREGPGAAQEAERLLDQVKPTLPILLANLTTLGQVGVTYRPSIEQLLVLVPPFVGWVKTSAPDHNPTGMPIGDFRVGLGDPPACTVGFLPPSQWRSPADTTTIDTPDGLYCKLPQDSPIAIRGARNYPCMGVPGKRAPTVQQCYSDQPYQPLAMRQHALGPYPLDPNLLAQGIPPDERIDFNNNIFAPVAGTPLPPGPPLAAGPPQPPSGTELPSAPAPPDPVGPNDGVASGTPSGFSTGAGSGQSVAVADYDPRTGRYATPDGQVFHQTDLVSTPKTWQDLMVTSHP